MSLLTLLLVGCGGGGGDAPRAAAPSAIPPPALFDLLFPGANSLSDGDQIAVVGAAAVSEVIIRNGADSVVALVDAAGRWRADAVPLRPGENTLIAELTEADGSVVEQTIAVVQSEPILAMPTAVLVDAARNGVYVGGPKQLFTLDLDTGSITLTSSATRGNGPRFVSLSHLALAADGAILAADFQRVLRVDPVTGDRSVLVELPISTLPIRTIARDRQLNRLFTVGLLKDLHVADLDAPPPILASPIGQRPTIGFGSGVVDSVYVPAVNSIYAVDPTGAGVFVIDGVTGEFAQLMLDVGGLPASSTGIDYDATNDRLLVLALPGSIISLDPNTSASSVLTPAPLTTTVPKALSGLSLSDQSAWTVAPAASELISLDLADGTQTVAVETSLGTGAPSGFMFAARYDAVGDRVVAASDLSIIAIDPASGDRQQLVNLVEPIIVAGPNPPAVPEFFLVNGIVLSQDGSRAWVTDQLTQTLAEVDLGSGDRQEISGPSVGSGPMPGQIAGIAVNQAETTAYIGDRLALSVLRIDLVSGQRELIVEFGTNFNRMQIQGLVLDEDGSRLLLHLTPFSSLSGDNPGIYALDLVSLELALVADLSELQAPVNTPATPGFPTAQMSLGPVADFLYLAIGDNPDIPYARIDLGLGEVSALGTATSGPAVFVPNAIEVAGDGRVFALDGTSALYVIDPVTGQRAIVSK